MDKSLVKNITSLSLAVYDPLTREFQVPDQLHFRPRLISSLHFRPNFMANLFRSPTQQSKIRSSSGQKFAPVTATLLVKSHSHSVPVLDRCGLVGICSPVFMLRAHHACFACPSCHVRRRKTGGRIASTTPDYFRKGDRESRTLSRRSGRYRLQRHSVGVP